MQGVNDCGIWTWLFPRIHLDSTLRQLVDCGGHGGVRRARGRAKDKGLDELFQNQVLSVLADHLGPEEKKKLAELASSSNAGRDQNENPDDTTAKERKAALRQQRNKAKAESFVKEAQRLGLQVGDTRNIPFVIRKEDRVFKGVLRGIDHRGLEFYFEADDTVTRFNNIPLLERFFERAELLLLEAATAAAAAAGAAPEKAAAPEKTADEKEKETEESCEEVVSYRAEVDGAANHPGSPPLRELYVL